MEVQRVGGERHEEDAVRVEMEDARQPEATPKEMELVPLEAKAAVDPGDIQLDTAPPKRRADIDGLRAVAVIAVIAFHAVEGAYASGFMGVDGVEPVHTQLGRLALSTRGCERSLGGRQLCLRRMELREQLRRRTGWRRSCAAHLGPIAAYSCS